MRKLIAVLALLLLPLSACGGDSTGPDNSFAGSYELRSIGGSPLPFTVIQVGADRLEVVSGTLTINEDGTFSDRATFRITESGNVTTEQEAVAGTYTRNNNAFTFSDTDGDVYSGSLQGNTMTVTVEGLILVYQK